MKQIKDYPETTEAANDDYLLLQSAAGITMKIKKQNLLQGLSSGGTVNTNQFNFESVGDNKGLIYYLGTGNGTQSTYANPATNGIITATSSSVHAGLAASNLFDRGTATAHTSTQANAFFKIDLGTNRKFKVKIYTLRARTDHHSQIPRNWKLQGSNDDTTWADLDTQTNRSDFNQGQWLAIDLANLSTGYRYFRLLQTGSNSSSDYYFTLGEWEMYGNLV